MAPLRGGPIGMDMLLVGIEEDAPNLGGLAVLDKLVAEEQDAS